MQTTCSSLVCCLGCMLLQCRLNNTLCLHMDISMVCTEISSPSSSYTLSHTIHTLLSAVCYALCFSSLIGFHECIWLLGNIRDVLYNLTDLPPGHGHCKCESFSVSTLPAFFFASMKAGADIERTLDLPRV